MKTTEFIKARIPVSTYRLQFNKNFRFPDAKAIIPYLHDLGITDIYSSPYLKAREGASTDTTSWTTVPSIPR